MAPLICCGIFAHSMAMGTLLSPYSVSLKGYGPVKSGVLEITKAKQSFTFVDVKERPVLSVNRGFSAPVVLKSNVTAADQLFLIGHDSDSFNRWEAAQTIGKNLIVKAVSALSTGGKFPRIVDFADAAIYRPAVPTDVSLPVVVVEKTNK